MKSLRLPAYITSTRTAYKVVRVCVVFQLSASILHAHCKAELRLSKRHIKLGRFLHDRYRSGTGETSNRRANFKLTSPTGLLFSSTYPVRLANTTSSFEADTF